MTRKRTEPLPSISDAVAAIGDLSRRHNLLLSAVQSALSIVDRMDEADKPRAALVGLDNLRPYIEP